MLPLVLVPATGLVPAGSTRRCLSASGNESLVAALAVCTPSLYGLACTLSHLECCGRPLPFFRVRQLRCWVDVVQVQSASAQKYAPPVPG